MILAPSAKRGPLIVDEYTAIFYSRLAVGIGAGGHVDVVVFCDGSVGPPVPGRYAYLPRQFVYAVDGAAFVAAYYDNIVAVIGDDVLFPFSFKLIDDVGVLVDGLAFAGRADDNRCLVAPCYGLQIVSQVVYRNYDSFPVGGIVLYRVIAVGQLYVMLIGA